MARALCIERPGGRYHVPAVGSEALLIYGQGGMSLPVGLIVFVPALHSFIATHVEGGPNRQVLDVTVGADILSTFNRKLHYHF